MNSINHNVANSMFGDSIYQRLDEDDDEEEANIGNRPFYDSLRSPTRVRNASPSIMRTATQVAASDDGSDDDGKHPAVSVMFAPQTKADSHSDEDDTDGGEPRSLLLDTQNSNAVEHGPRIPWSRRAQKRALHPKATVGSSSPQTFSTSPAFNLLNPRERALWKWANVEDLDLFLQQVYSYFLGNGIYCILLNRALNMA
jgi:Autophagy protein ATG9